MLPTGKGLLKPLFGARQVLVISICKGEQQENGLLPPADGEWERDLRSSSMRPYVYFGTPLSPTGRTQTDCPTRRRSRKKVHRGTSTSRTHGPLALVTRPASESVHSLGFIPPAAGASYSSGGGIK